MRDVDMRNRAFGGVFARGGRERNNAVVDSSHRPDVGRSGNRPSGNCPSDSRSLVFCFGLALLAQSCFVFGQASSANAQDVDLVDAAAVVNDEVISSVDVAKRLSLSVMESQIPLVDRNNPELVRQVLHRLIDERLQLQEAARIGVWIGAADVAEGLAELARQNDMDPDTFYQNILSSGLSLESIEDQIRATLAWRQTVRRLYEQRSHVSEAELDLFLDMLKDREIEEYRLHEIYLAVPSAADSLQALSVARYLREEILEGASFSRLAREFSQAQSASRGGDVGWIRLEGLDPALQEMILALKPGEISEPLFWQSGYYLLLIEDRRRSASPLSREELRERLTQERLQRYADTALHKLRAAAEIDIRL